MNKKKTSIYQFKVTLEDITPKIWRRIQVPESYSFWDLHVAIQDAMGWEDYHFHQFMFPSSKYARGTVIGIPDEDGFDDFNTLSGWKEKIGDYLSLEQPQAIYEYDFGDGWSHLIELEKILPREEKTKYPTCIDGKRACPPEDCGGPWGYADLLEILADPSHEEHDNLTEWVGGKFDPETFDPQKIKFDDPKKRFKRAFAA